MALEQNYSNHVRRVPAFLVTLLLLLATFIGSCVNLYKSWGDHERIYSASLILALCIATIAACLFSRTFALKAQDRAVRAEENLRHYVLTGKLLDGRLEVPQIVALRFAPDAELPDLARQAAEQGTAPDAIKKSIKNWCADWYRV